MSGHVFYRQPYMSMFVASPYAEAEFRTPDGTCGQRDARGESCMHRVGHVNNCQANDGEWDRGVKCPTCSGKGTVATP